MTASLKRIPATRAYWPPWWGYATPISRLTGFIAVLAAEPTWVAVSVGMNDVWHRREGRGGVPLGTFRTAYRELLRRLRSRDIHIACLTPTVLGEDRNSDANRELGRAAAVIGAEALAAGARVADMHRAFLPILGHRRLTLDGVRMNLLGNVLMADTLYDVLREPRAVDSALGPWRALAARLGRCCQACPHDGAWDHRASVRCCTSERGGPRLSRTVPDAVPFHGDRPRSRRHQARVCAVSPDAWRRKPAVSPQ
ncbi:MAG: GDSL-type esterase/lipase family protein [Thermaerobacter sp.]|nr:GDSL-type esterase/lipase family protein [Thermaerobacter sp.]